MLYGGGGGGGGGGGAGGAVSAHHPSTLRPLSPNDDIPSYLAVFLSFLSCIFSSFHAVFLVLICLCLGSLSLNC